MGNHIAHLRVPVSACSRQLCCAGEQVVPQLSSLKQETLIISNFS